MSQSVQNVLSIKTICFPLSPSLTPEILFLPREHKIHIFSPPCNILYCWFSLSRNEKIKSKPLDKNNQELVMLWEINSLSTLPSLRSLRIFVLELAVKMFYKNLKSSVWKRHSCVPERDTVMAAGNQWKHLEFTSAIKIDLFALLKRGYPY